MLSIHYNTRIRVKTYTNKISPVPLIISLFNEVNWFEKEVYDMYSEAASPWEQTSRPFMVKGPGNDERSDSYKLKNLLPKPKSSEKK
ncbi:hypothetical protein C2G38_2197418 [Gigaspora rosea]|uniref:NADH:ubiquinone oxidoreductase 30kDa subunit domain-containing protein n=1 Tax=Gigaspora rosea TaxID=44941 RepID=A0A397UW69_9GLOM|nr:hypothetical protein C2G38_2197418 [Gigaspora rosea]